MRREAATDHPIHDLLRYRWSPRSFADRPVDRSTLLRLLEAARWAPSSYNGQPWAFLVATREDAPAFEKMLDCLIEFNQTWAKNAPVLMLPLARTTFEHNDKPNPHAWHDVGLAVANLTVQASAEGLFVHQMAGIIPAQIRTTYALPEQFEPVTAIALGYLGDPSDLSERLRERETTPSERKPQSQFVFAGRFGQPFVDSNS